MPIYNWHLTITNNRSNMKLANANIDFNPIVTNIIKDLEG